MATKKIYLTVTNDLTYDQRMIRIATTLAQSGYEVCLIGRLRNNSKPLKTQPFAQKRLKCWFDKGKFFYLEYNWRLFFYLLSSPLDAVGSIDLDTLLAGYLVTRLKRKPCIYDAHEYFTEVPEVVERPAVQQIWERLAQWIIPRLNYAYTVCGSLQKVFQERYGTSFSVIRNVPFQKAPPVQQLDFAPPFIFLYQGVLNDGRGLEELIMALPELPQVHLWLAGEGDLSTTLRQLVGELEVGEQVTFLGYIQPDALQEVTKKAHFGLNLLQNKGLNYYYSLANKFFDYVQAYKPSVNMAFPEYTALLKEHQVGIALPDLQKSTLVTALKTLTSSPQQYQLFQQACQVASQVWIWEKEATLLQNFYQQVFKDD